jgi:hypothetical protein
VKIKGLIKEKVAVIDSINNSIKTEERIEEAINLGYDVIVTFADYDYSLS